MQPEMRKQDRRIADRLGSSGQQIESKAEESGQREVEGLGSSKALRLCCLCAV